MKCLLLCLSAFLLCTIVFSHHGGEHDEEHADHTDDHKHNHGDHKHSNDHGGNHKNHGHHGKGKHDSHHHVHFNESIACHKIASSNSQFAFRLFKQVTDAKPLENIFISPVSISTAFAMLSEGAKSKTHDEILEGLGFNISEITAEEIHSCFQHHLHVLNHPDSELHLDSGNALFIDTKLKLRQTFLDDVKRNYESEAFSSDFTNSDEAKNQINSYVDKKTNGKIPELLSSIDKDTILILLNWIYFRGQWKNPFNEEFTSEGDFHVDENTVVKVPFMRRIGVYNVLLSENVTVVEIPYKGNASALFILPKEGKLRHIEQNLQESTIKAWKSKFRFRFVEIYLPKFVISTTLDLKKQFIKMGVTKVFSNAADLSGITEQAKLKLSTAVHKGALSVDEKGTEAVAATVLELVPISLPPTIKLDNPFLILIQKEETHSPLFMGRVRNPAVA
ncbi:alpha-1-antitrypsin-like [Pelobates fuscus]|uniref:alpha-1-antitrypsin-like n=1 Tax=Pelobates fuscus TaxID=191477 RepID=UPI002FE4A65B